MKTVGQSLLVHMVAKLFSIPKIKLINFLVEINGTAKIGSNLAQPNYRPGYKCRVSQNSILSAVTLQPRLSSWLQMQGFSKFDIIVRTSTSFNRKKTKTNY